MNKFLNAVNFGAVKSFSETYRTNELLYSSHQSCVILSREAQLFVGWVGGSVT
ncbi:unknown protein [Microcystis aeruginosa NIES-843]|uniref:Uncharacterized protein n=1 Tax=Microcystis aeruginosa (strain NIES-843 / IAM M-2473) TaxID=449447 RepID=B0JQZ4_MICAN|nr:unknown protein [Microcystis aeruginosa NIES-843]